MSTFSDLVRARSQRSLLTNGTLWGGYQQLIIATGPLLSGFALWMGLRASDIALIAAVAALAGLVQPLSFLVARVFRDQKRFVIGFGFAEAILVATVAVVPLIASSRGARFALAATFVLGGTLMANLAAPLFNSWFSSLISEEDRARFLGRRLLLANLAAMVVEYACGQLIDLLKQSHAGFAVSYLLALGMGIGGYWLLSRIPFPSLLNVGGPVSLRRMLVAPLMHGQFRRLLVFFLMLVMASLLGDPFYNVFMIRDLGVSYATIGVLNSVVLGVGILGYRVFGSVVEKYGAKPVLELLMVPRFILPFVWVLLTPQNKDIVLPLIMVTNGLVFSGLTVAINTLLFGSVPKGSEAASFFATWSFGAAAVTSAATAVGGVLAGLLRGLSFALGPLRVGNLQMLFTLSGLFMLVPLLLLRAVPDTRAKPVMYLLGQVFRGNPLSFVYSSFVFQRLRKTRTRARFARAMGRSRSPMAVDRLARALDDADPEVREQAAKGLGETGAVEALPPLLAELDDPESDLHALAAESLGRLRHPRGIEPLLAALSATDVRVAIAAARALGDIGGDRVREMLLQKIDLGADKTLFPTLVESLSRLGDIRVVPPALRAMTSYKSPVIRLQLLNAACRGLGAGVAFYELLSKDDLELAEDLDQMLQTMARELRKIPMGRRRKESLMERHTALRSALETERYAEMPDLAAEVAEMLPTRDPRVAAGLGALGLYRAAAATGHAERPEIFSVVCLGIMVDASV